MKSSETEVYQNQSVYRFLYISIFKLLGTAANTGVKYLELESSFPVLMCLSLSLYTPEVPYYLCLRITDHQNRKQSLWIVNQTPKVIAISRSFFYKRRERTTISIEHSLHFSGIKPSCMFWLPVWHHCAVYKIIKRLNFAAVIIQSVKFDLLSLLQNIRSTYTSI